MPAFLIHRFCLLVMLTGALIGTPASAREAAYEESARKHSWLSFNRPHKTSAAAQLAHAHALREEGSLRAASKQYRALVMTWPGSPEAPDAQLHLARTLDDRGDPEAAFDEFQLLIEKYPGRYPYAEVLSRQMDIAVAVGERRRLAWFGLSGFQAPERAIPLLEKVIQNGPASPRAAEAQYRIGAAYEVSKQPDLAVGAYLLCEERHPETPFAEKAALGRTRCWHTLAADSPNDEGTQEEAYAATVSFLQRYRKSEHTELVRTYQKEIYERRARQAYDRALFYDRVSHKPAAALRSYESLQRFFPASPLAADVEARVVALRAMKETSDAKND